MSIWEKFHNYPKFWKDLLVRSENSKLFNKNNNNLHNKNIKIKNDLFLKVISIILSNKFLPIRKDLKVKDFEIESDPKVIRW
jgi:hypothetical protein